MVEVPKELTERIYKLIESVKVDGKLRKGTNETTKAVEKSEAQLVITADDINPKEIIMHLPVLCKERDIPYVTVPSKSELGASAGLPVSTSSIAIVNPGDAKKLLLDVLKNLENLQKASSKGKPKEAPVEKPVEKPKEKPKEEAPTKEEPVQEEEKVEEKPVEEPKEEVPEAESEDLEQEPEQPTEETPEEQPQEIEKQPELPKEEVKEEPKVEEKPKEEEKEAEK